MTSEKKAPGGVLVNETYGIPVGLWCLATAEVAEGPSCVAQHAELPAIADQGQERAESARTENEVAALRAITGNVSESPDCLLSDIRFRVVEEFDEDGNSASLNDDLGLLGRSGSNIGQSPGGLKLHQGVRGTQEFDEASDDSGLDDTLNRRVAFLGQQLSELRCRLDLLLDLVRKYTSDHLR